MNNKIILTDLDWTLIKPRSGGTFPLAYDDLEIINHNTIFSDTDATYVALSNQGGIDAGYQTMGDTIKRMKLVLDKVHRLSSVYFVPDFNGKRIVEVSRELVITYDANPGEFFRKPDIGAAKLIEDNHDGQIIKMYGDREDDRKFAQSAGIPFILITEYINNIL